MATILSTSRSEIQNLVTNFIANAVSTRAADPANFMYVTATAPIDTTQANKGAGAIAAEGLATFLQEAAKRLSGSVNTI
jgi:hypothetical protein